MTSTIKYSKMKQLLVVICIGLLGYTVLDSYVEPWVIETVCKELFKCDY